MPPGRGRLRKCQGERGLRGPLREGGRRTRIAAWQDSGDLPSLFSKKLPRP
ncbi:unnamed protein product [Tenebrio molitor]|nr:unnamed protein product [Tenebrio molitor]